MDLKTRKEWKELGFSVPLRCKPVEVRTSEDGKETKLFSKEQAKPIYPSRIWKYDVRSKMATGPVLSNLPFIREQLFLANRYKHSLIELERERRGKVDNKLRELSPDYVAICAEVTTQENKISAAADEISKRNARARRRTATDEDRATLDGLYAALKSLWARQSQIKKPLFRLPAFKAAQAIIDADHKEDTEASYADYDKQGLYWGTRGAVLNALDEIKEGAPPKHLPWDKGGQLRCQIQKGLTLEEAYKGRVCKNDQRKPDERLRIKEESYFNPHDPSKEINYTIVSVRLGSKKRDAIWVDCPIVLHGGRPLLPSGAIIKEVLLTAKRIGYEDHYSLCFVVNRPEGFGREDKAATGALGIDLRWRPVEAGIRVACYHGSDGREDELVIPHLVDPSKPAKGLNAPISYYLHIREIQGERSTLFNHMMLDLADWCKDAELPEWLADVKPKLSKIKSAERMIALFRKWEENRISGDETIFARMNHWAREEKQLGNKERASFLKFERWRKHYYENFWVRMQRRYASVYFEDMDIAALRQSPNPEDKEGNAAMIRYANLVAAGMFREKGCNYMSATLVPTENSTRECAFCHNLCSWDQRNELEHTCEHCGKHWDQCYNAARNIFARGEALNQKPGTARVA